MRGKHEELFFLFAVCMIASAPELAAAEPRAGEHRELHLAPWPIGIAEVGGPQVLFMREGAEVPMRELMSVEDSNRELRFKVSNGDVRFGDGSTATSGSADQKGVVATPAFRAGRAHDRGSIEITSRGRSLGVLHVQTIPISSWSLVLDVLSKDPGVVLERTPEYAVVNTALMKASGEAVQQELGSVPHQVVDAAGAGMRATSTCWYRFPWGPGWVEWTASDPAGWGFSVKPEKTWPLVWGRAPSQDVDGIYNRSWGCYTAIKVPDNCTATSGPEGTSCCCNAAAAALGHVCEWANPADQGWPLCPL